MSVSAYKRLHPWMCNFGRNTVLSFMREVADKRLP